MRQFDNIGADLIYTDFRVYIEGVEVPFSSASVSNTYNDKPRATITMPAYRGLTDLGKNYYPKVHIFYRDFNQPLSPYEQSLNGYAETDLDDNRHAYKQLFEGVIRNVQDSKSTSGMGSSMVVLDCVHPSYVLDEITMNIISLKPVQSNSASVMGAANVAAVSSLDLIHKSLVGNYKPVTGSASFGRGTYDPCIASDTWADNIHRLVGMPGVIASLWNSIKYQAVATGASVNKNTVESANPLLNMYAPLLEEGLKFFSKLTGHALVEDMTLSNMVAPVYNSDTKGTTEESTEKRPLLAPVTMSHYLKNAVASALSLTLNQLMGGAGPQGEETNEVASYGNIINTFLNFIKYDMVILNSPVSRAHILGKDTREHLEYIAKPTLPMYYAPICNVILPNMLDSLSISFQNEGVPSRIGLKASVIMDGYGTYGIFNNMNYTAPHSVRLVNWENEKSIKGTLSSYVVNVGRNEWGYGIRFLEAQAPYWYNMLMNDTAENDPDGSVSFLMDESNVQKAADTWDNIFMGNASFNPWRTGGVTGLKPHEVVNFVSADNEFVRMMANTRVGNVNCAFNPFIIPGYPMDVIDPSPERESYHGLCTSVHHSIDASGYCTTSVGMASVLTYSELVTCYIPITEPWQISALGFTDSFSLYNNRPAYERACTFYSSVLGVGAADPSLLENYSMGIPTPVVRDKGTWALGVKTGTSLYESVIGNLILVGRNIKSLPEVEAEYCPNSETFIDIEMWNEGAASTYNQPKYGWAEDTEVIAPGYKGKYLETSPYLDYDTLGETPDYYLFALKIDPTMATPYQPITSGGILSNAPKFGGAPPESTGSVIDTTDQGTGSVCRVDGIFDPISWAKLRTCDERLQKVFLAVHKISPCIVTSGARSASEQERIYAQQGDQGLAARPGRSKHNLYPAKAVDVVPCEDRHGTHMSATRSAFASLVKSTAAGMGITVRWGGEFRTPDSVHFYLD